MTLTLFVLGEVQRLLAQATPPPAAPAAAPVPWQTTMAAFGTIASASLAAAVAVVSSRRERKARKERDDLAARQTATEHRRPASLVSAWVDEGYIPNLDGRTYTRGAVVRIANEGEQPMFNVSVAVGVGRPTRNIGPLTVPNRIPVLPPNREGAWTITLPLLAHPDSEEPCAALIFDDPAGNRWVRHFDGTLEEVTGKTARLVEAASDEDGDLQVRQQLGDFTELYNPMTLAFAFLFMLQEPADNFDFSKFQELLAPEAPGWQKVTEQDLDDIRADLEDYSVGTMPNYPVPHVAYVKVIQQAMETTMVVSGEGSLELPSQFLTLTLVEGRGWRVFGYGSRVAPERILFPPGTLGPFAGHSSERSGEDGADGQVKSQQHGRVRGWRMRSQ